MKQLHHLRIVIASPSDVKEERKILEEVATELNRDIAKAHGLYLETSGWDLDAYPGFHVDGPQGLIDSILQIEDCELFIGIFWKRFGTPTLDAKSGTEHEFRKAYEAWKRTQRPQIMIYFNDEDATPKTREELVQRGLIIDFKDKFPKEGLWWSYNGKQDFQNCVRKHLTQFILRMAQLTQKSVNNNTSTAIITPTFNPPPKEEQISQWIKSKGSKRTRKQYEAIMPFRQLLLKSNLDLDSEDVIRISSLAEDWAYGKKGGEIAGTTFNNRLSILSSFYIFAMKRKWVKSNPIKLIERRVQRNINAAEAIEVEKVKNALKSIDRSRPEGKRDYALLCLLLTTGRHVSEVVELRCGAITRGKNGMTITFKLIRSGEVLAVPLSPGVAKSLNEYISSAYPNSFAVDSPLWPSFSRNTTKGKPIGTQAVAKVCNKYLGTTKVEATKRTYDSIRYKFGIEGLEKKLGIN